MELTVTSTPLRLADLVGIRPAALAEDYAVALWSGWIEHAAGPPVYLRRSPTAPDPSSDQGSRLTGRARRYVVKYGGGVYGGPLWAWTARGSATLIVEEAAMPT